MPIVKDGSIYPLLARLERRGALTSYQAPAAAGPPRRHYQVTDIGRAELQDAREVWAVVAGGVDALLDRAADRGGTGRG